MAVKVKLTRANIKKAEEFAGLRADDSSISLYKKRGGFKKEDILAGALGELAVAAYLKSQGVKCPKPDFTIHDCKSYAADLIIADYFLHVKSQTLASEKKYGKSWLMQRTDPALKNQNKDYMVFTTVDIEEGIVYIHGFYNLKTLVDSNLIGECAVPSFRKTKVAIYLEDVDKKCTSKQRWGLVPRLKEV